MSKHRKAKNSPQRVVAEPEAPKHEEIAALAYRLWQEGGYRDGHADEDWARAQQMLREGGTPESAPLAAIA